MIGWLRNTLAPPVSGAGGETGYRRLLRWAAVPLTDRRWAAPLSAVALGFGLFVGVAIGPGATGTFATGAAQIVEIPVSTAGEDGGSGGAERASSALAPASGSASGEGEGFPLAPLAPSGEAPSEPAATAPSGSGPAPEGGKEEEPIQPEDQELVGTVVHVNPEAGSYTVAEAGGVMSAVHAGNLPAAGARIEVPIRSLANGTLAEAGQRHTKSSQARVALAGIVTFADSDPAAPGYTVSNRGVSTFVRVHADAAGAPPLPALGSYVSVTVDIEAFQPPSAEPAPQPPAPTEAPCAASAERPPAPAPAAPESVLWQRELSGGGAPFTHSDFEGIVMAVCPETSQLLVSADDVRESGKDLLFAVPPAIDTTQVTVGESVAVSADIGADGSPTLTGLASDERLKGADDANATRGDLVPEKPKGMG